MSIALRGTTTASIDGGFDFELGVPSGVMAGDFLIAHVSYCSGGGSANVTPPAGWTLVRTDTTFTDSGGVSTWLYQRIASSSEPASYHFTFHDFRQGAGGMVAYSGVKTNDPFDVTDVSISTASTTPTSPSVSTVYTQPQVLWFLTARDNLGSDTATQPGGMTQQWRVNSSIAPGCVSLFADLVFAGPGTVPAKAGAISPSAQTITTVLVLNPADENPNYVPTANAGPDVATEIGSGVTLDGSGSADRNPGDTLTYAWTHLSGPNSTAQLSSTTVASPLFTPTAAGLDTFRLTVTDQSNATASDDVTVSTTPIGVNVAFAAGNGTSAAITVPSGAQSGDVAYLAIATRPLALPPGASGWSAVQQATAGGSSTDISLSVFARRLAAGDLGSTVTIDLNDIVGGDWTAQIVTVRGLQSPQLYNKVLGTLPLASPHSFSNSVVGGAGSATYTYTVTAIDDAGETVASGTQVVGSAPTTLSSSNYVELIWQPSARATSYNVYGRSGGSQQLIAHVVQPQTVAVDEFFYIYHDTGTAPGSQTPPTQQPMGWLMDGLNLEGDGTTLMPERLFTTYSGGKLLLFAAAQIDVANPGVSVSDPAGASVLTTTQTPNNKIVLHSAIETLGAAQTVGTRLFTPTDYATMWSTIGLVLRPTGANGTPTAIAGFDQLAEVGTLVYLDASQSYDEDGDTLNYLWTQTSGPAVTLSSTTAQFPSFKMPKTAVTFQLKASDPSGAFATDSVTVTPIQAGQLKVKNSSGTWISLP